jgi:hypothetical protein
MNEENKHSIRVSAEILIRMYVKICVRRSLHGYLARSLFHSLSGYVSTYFIRKPE